LQIARAKVVVEMVREFNILIVDDDDRILNFLKSKLKAHGYTVLTANNGAEALEQVKIHNVDLMVLDIIMPKMDGIQALTELRTFSTVPVLMLSAKATDIDKIKGLSSGADDYLIKPFNPDELVARIEAIRRRIDVNRKIEASKVIILGNLHIDMDGRRIFADGIEMKLTRIEWLLLTELAQHAGRLMSYEELLTRIWGPEYRDDIHTLRSWMSRLRGKLNKQSVHGNLIRTVPRVGYMIDVPH